MSRALSLVLILAQLIQDIQKLANQYFHNVVMTLETGCRIFGVAAWKKCQLQPNLRLSSQVSSHIVKLCKALNRDWQDLQQDPGNGDSRSDRNNEQGHPLWEQQEERKLYIVTVMALAVCLSTRPVHTAVQWWLADCPNLPSPLNEYGGNQTGKWG